jgi:hypothetical protein
MPSHSLYTVFHESTPECPDMAALVEELEALGMPRRWPQAAWVIPPLLNLYCLRNSESGDVSHLSAERIAEIVRWPLRGKAQRLVDALVRTGFLERNGDGKTTVHNFTWYNRRILSERARKRKGGALAAHAELVEETACLFGGKGAEGGAESAPQVRGKGAEDSAPGGAESARKRRGKVGGMEVEVKELLKNPSVLLSQTEGVAGTAGAERARSTAGGACATHGTETAAAARPVGVKPTTATTHGTAAASKGEAQTADVKAASGSGEPADRNAPSSAGLRGTAVPGATDPEPAAGPFDLGGELLRRAGWGEQNVRRMLKWLGGYKGGGWRRAAQAEDWWRALALALQVQRRQASTKRLPLENVVSYWITLVDEGREPSPEDLTTARVGWEQLEREGAGDPPAWLMEALRGIGR